LRSWAGDLSAGRGFMTNVIRPLALTHGTHPLFPIFLAQSFGAVGLNEKKAPLESVEEMAVHYLEEIRKAPPRGPYHLGGECFGGMVVDYEMAQQLKTGGEEVAFRACIDRAGALVHR
jgi:thioesterase domain-containing protein